MKKKKKTTARTEIAVLRVVIVRISDDPSGTGHSHLLKDMLDEAGFSDVGPDPWNKQYIKAYSPANEKIVFLLEVYVSENGNKGFELVSIDRDTRREIQSGEILYLPEKAPRHDSPVEVNAIGDERVDWSIFCVPASAEEIEANRFLKENPCRHRVRPPPLELSVSHELQIDQSILLDASVEKKVKS